MTAPIGIERLDYEKRLDDIAITLRAGEQPARVPVRELIHWFAASRRGSVVVPRIRQALAEKGLTTTPDFETAFIDGEIEFALATPISDNHKPVDLPGTGSVGPEDICLPSSEYAERIYPLGMLKAANRVPLSVKPNATVESAITLMWMHDYSQLPVQAGERDVKGVITWKSIAARWAISDKGEFVQDFMDEPAIIDARQSLFDAIPTIVTKGFVLVCDNSRKVSGIVTATDLSGQFRELAEPFLLIREIENQIRRLIDGKFTKLDLDDVRHESSPAPEAVTDLSFGQYVRLLEDKERWAKLSLPIERAAFIHRLNEIREIRNDVMHFNPDPMQDRDLDTLREFSRFLHSLHRYGA